MSYLVDTNILLRLVHKSDSMHLITKGVLVTLQKQGEALWIVPQNLIEFWAVATRPTNGNGLGLTASEAYQEMSLLKRLFSVKEDVPGIATIWESLVVKYQVLGKQTHDTRLVAAMIAHQITYLLSFNVNDFKRFSEIQVVDPRNFKGE
ncbi:MULTISPECIES: type II toxin-antitoxin system VapC family toxin [Nostocales]|uniref:Type II toxin-antitoxin system VapC family toxin n=2 Tax=Nostocales TaxID=1161 RepID=A0A8S9T3N7_9CYAN|nr:type II toxin-antitoxin system VapC family toxin [Tolypothrix bouteillei]KAF3886688.1 type II toxin-antitoxin system VapC family toxin [Tolypothrix bouteillei VB521301]